MTCVFCAIVAGEVPSSSVYADDRVVAFMDLHPVTPGHLLVIPRTHAPTLGDLDPADASRMMTVAQELAEALRASTVPTDGINLLLADGAVAGQEVFHCHLHVIPRTPHDGLVIDAPFASPTRDELDAHADAIRSALDRH
ncbi:MAG TPA: HIT family protein [Dermatophilaceae bacterium]|jgi:histidine triad (HIT) family protein|nr:HIT family protein [Dermatophilaceae bacterium]